MKRPSAPAAMLVCLLAASAPLWCQQEAKPAPDSLILKDGERLIGHLTHATGKEIVFKSDLLGELTVKWSNITELHTAERVVVIPKEGKRRGKDVLADAPQGTISATPETITITQASGQTQTAPVAATERVIDAAIFERDVVRTPGLFEDWTGTLTAGASLVEATQHSENFTTAVALVRGIPPEGWLEKRSRTELDFISSYGTVTQPASPALKTNIFHAGAQQDQYFSPAFYVFAQALFDHNFSQGLSLQQTYAGGIGWSVISNSATELDLRAGLDYERQQFATGPEQNLIGSTFSQNLLHKFHRGWTLTEHLNVTPSWNNTRALLANGSVTFTMPVYKNLNFTTSIIDAFLNDPPAGFRKNSFQFTTGVSYTLK